MSARRIRTGGSGRSSSRDRRRRAAASSRPTSRGRCRQADRVILPAVFRSTLPEAERLSTEQLVNDLKAAGVDARYIPNTDDIVATVVAREPGRRSRDHHVERRLRRHSSEAADRARAPGAESRDASRSGSSPAGDAALRRGAARAHRPGAERLVRRACRARSRRAWARSSATSSIGYCSVTVYFDPLQVDAAWLEGEVRASAGDASMSRTPPRAPLVEVPVCYGGDLGPDLADVAAFAACSEAEVDRPARRPRVSRLHGRLRSRLRLHGRGRAEDRRAAASVAAHGRAGGVGRDRRRTDRRLPGRHARRLEHHRPHAARPYDPDRPEPFLFKSGDRVRFRPISDARVPSSRDAAPSRVVRPGMLTTVQDLGRWGFQANGVPVAGPMDEYSHVLANRLVGNTPVGRGARSHADRAGAAGGRRK